MTTDDFTTAATQTDSLIDALHGHFMLDAVGPIGCECPKASDEEHIAIFVLSHLAAQEPTRVDPARIEEQRALGWPDMHPEDYCHRCGNRNPSWFVSAREQWLAGTRAWAEETGREGICCPTCFMEMWEEQHGAGWSMEVRMAPPGETAQKPTDAEARLQAVKDVLTEWEHVKHTKRILRDLRDALDGTQ